MGSLSIRCELLLGSYQAADPFGDPGTPEWPPHPYRLHAALLAAACEAGGEEPARDDIEALRWLEGQGLPHLHCDETAEFRTSPDAYVPRNPVKTELSNSHRAWAKDRTFQNPWLRNARKFPTALPANPVVRVSWHGTGRPPAALERLAAGVAWLGSSRSPVGCSVTDRPDTGADEAARFVPAALGRHSIRVAAEGTTDALLNSRHSWPAPYQPPTVAYAVRADDGAKTEPEPVFQSTLGELLIRPVRNPTHDLAHTVRITTALRLAMLSKTGDAAPECLHGHGSGENHAAYLALADIDHPHATGRIHGIAIALPKLITSGERELIVSSLVELDEIGLGKGVAPVRLSSKTPPLLSLRPERWTRPSRRYATVTPIILDRHPKKSAQVEDELLRSLTNAGYGDVVEAVDVMRVPAVPGGVSHGRLLGDLPNGYRCHARVLFRVPVRGPVTAGRGRYRGIGLLMPQNDQGPDDVA